MGFGDHTYNTFHFVFNWSWFNHCCVLQVYNNTTLLCFLVPQFPSSPDDDFIALFCRSSDRGKDWYICDQFWASIGCRHGKTFIFISTHMLCYIVYVFLYYSSFSYSLPLSVSVYHSLLSVHNADFCYFPKSFFIFYSVLRALHLFKFLE